MSALLFPRPCTAQIASVPEIERLVAAGAAVAIGVSGGKDSQAAAVATITWLDRHKHRGPRILIHADLGEVEWRDSLPVCEQLAAHLGYDLVVVRRTAGGLMQRWEARWESSKRRYAQLETVTLVLPWSTPGMRFCTSELKAAPIAAELRRRYRGLPIINVTGVRRQESRRRALLPVADQDVSRRSRAASEFWNWRPLSHWSTEDVFACIARAGLQPHPAYTRFDSTRVSCVYCIMATAHDLMAAAQAQQSHDIYRRMVDLECASTFAFQGSRWLGDIAPHLLQPVQRDTLARAKHHASIRKIIESRIPDDLRFTKGRPVRIPNRTEATLLADVRNTVAKAVGFSIDFDRAETIEARYRAIMAGASTSDYVHPNALAA